MKNSFDELLVEEALESEIQSRKKTEEEVRIDESLIDEYELEGWTLKKLYKNGNAIMVKDKEAENALKDRLWTILYKMGFKIMSQGDFVYEVSNEYVNLQKNIDIVAIDDETCLFIDCYASKYLDRSRDFEAESGESSKIFKYLCNEIRNRYGDRKCKYILATSNYILSDDDISRITNKGVTYFNEENVNYYSELVNHLGSAARYQLLGNLFSKMTIKNMDERIPAIEGKMGNLTYYSFLIEPERLLKIGYVLHRNKANHDQMPTYQRLIKKERLTSIREYVNNGGFFPNSLIISLESHGGKLKFEKAPQTFQNGHSRLGTLYLPKEYQTAYIIDGQHRLYGYSDSKYAGTDTLPVVAFVDLDKDKQVKMFMDINENQKPVSKTLRNILNIDLNWNSENLSKRREAVILSVCQSLGEKTNSPLYGCVITGEDSITQQRCITIDYLKAAIEKCNFFNKYNKKNEIVERGLFDNTNSEDTYQRVYEYLRKCLVIIHEMCKEEWENGSLGFVAINNTMVGIIRVIGDITNYTFKKYDMDINNFDDEELYNKSLDLLADFADTINTWSLEKGNDIKSAKGAAAKDTSWRTLQVALHNYNLAFINADIEKYIEENCMDYNTDGLNELLCIKEHIINSIKNYVCDKYDWENIYLPEDLQISLSQRVSAQQIKNNRNGVDASVNIWDVIDYDDICKFLNFKTNWTLIGKDIFSSNDLKATRPQTISLIKSIQSSDKKINNGKQITKTEYQTINSLYTRFQGE